MSTDIRPELSEKNQYWIDKHRYYELKHYCLQYQSWKKIIRMLDYLATKKGDCDIPISKYLRSRPVEELAVRRVYFQDKVDLLENTCKKADPELSDYLLEAVTNGFSYDILKVRTNIPCGKDTYYNLYRKFFWLLDKCRA